MSNKPKAQPAPGPYRRELVGNPNIEPCIHILDRRGLTVAAVDGAPEERDATAQRIIDSSLVPGVERYDDEGNDKIYEHEAVTQYWLKHYAPLGVLCVLCGNSGIVDTTSSARNALGQPAGAKTCCICPNGQLMRWWSTQRDADA